jgi:hypothetical protein
MQIMRPVIWLNRNAGENPDDAVRDFRPGNEAPARAVDSVVFVAEDGDTKGGASDPKASSVIEPASGSPNGGAETETPSSPSETLEGPADAGKEKILHPSFMKPGNPEPPAGE